MKGALKAYVVKFRLPSREVVLRSSKKYAKDREELLTRIVLARTLEGATARAKAYAAWQWQVVSVEEVRDAGWREGPLAKLQVIE